MPKIIKRVCGGFLNDEYSLVLSLFLLNGTNIRSNRGEYLGGLPDVDGTQFTTTLHASTSEVEIL